MKRVVIRNSGQELVGNLIVADSILTRMKGLLGKDSLQSGSGLLLKPCKGVHTFGMRFAIDVVILDRENRVIAIKNRLKPNRMTAIYLSATTVLELPAATASAAKLSVGDFIEIVD